ncbi:GyrI-like domain-containing protein [Pseudomonas sp. MYb118]|uniref:GyrI-like domain-containing protein n=1 Tax=Pseudomonas sp. MYb118 TaxID=1848720 RepID=UPI0034CDAC25
MDEPKSVELAEPRIEHGHFRLIAGLGGRFNQQTVKDIVTLWDQFVPHIGRIPGQVGGETYGVGCNFGDNDEFDYIAGVEISKLDDLPDTYRWVELPPQRYVVFDYKGPLSQLPQVFQYIHGTWLPQSGHELLQTPEFERYSDDFNPQLNTGTLEIWLPIKA